MSLILARVEIIIESCLNSIEKVGTLKIAKPIKVQWISKCLNQTSGSYHATSLKSVNFLHSVRELDWVELRYFLDSINY